MRIQIMNENEAIKYTYTHDKDDYIIISINSPGYEVTKLNKLGKYKAVLWLSFNDIDTPYYNLEPKQGDFVGLKQFIDDYKDNANINNIIVHCAAGISRSSALASAISKYLNLNYKSIWKDNYLMPNPLVFKLALNELNINITQKEINELKNINYLKTIKFDLPTDLF